MKAQRESSGISILSLTSALYGVCGQRHAPAALPPGKETWYPLYRRLCGPQDLSGHVRNISFPKGFDPQTVQPAASRYTDWAWMHYYLAATKRYA